MSEISDRYHRLTEEFITAVDAVPAVADVTTRMLGLLGRRA